MSSAMDELTTPRSAAEHVDAKGRIILPVKLQLTKIFMRRHEGGEIFPWDGKDPSGRCSVFILSKLEEGFIHGNISIGDLRTKLFNIERRPSFDVMYIPTTSVIGKSIGCPVIGTYLYPPPSTSRITYGITTQEGQTLLENLKRDGHILQRTYRNPSTKNTFWFKFKEGEPPPLIFINNLKFFLRVLQI